MTKIIIAGDLCPQDRVSIFMEQGRYENILGEVKPIIESANYSLVNLECPIVNSPNSVPIKKCGPNLKTSKKVAELIKYAGFKGVTLANNHLLDYGDEGVADTLAACRDVGVDTVGGGMNFSEAERILYKVIGGFTVAFINCCEHEFSIATSNSAGANPLNAIQQYYAIQEAHVKADYVFVIVHGGHEHFQLPSPRMQEIYHFFVDCGADVVINHHQHCYSGYEVYKGTPIFYGLGNFCFDNSCIKNSLWNQGYLVELKIDETIEFILWPYNQCNEFPGIRLMKNEEMDTFVNHIDKLNEIINDSSELFLVHQAWMNKTNRSYLVAFSPYSNRYFRGLCKLGIIPSFLTKKRVALLLNYINCESHKERTINLLYNYLYK